MSYVPPTTTIGGSCPHGLPLSVRCLSCSPLPDPQVVHVHHHSEVLAMITDVREGAT